jgi:hypothetical protein
LVGFYGGMQYFDELYGSLMSSIMEGPYLVIPPYQVFREETSLDDMKQYDCGMASITLLTKRYDRLRVVFQEFKNNQLALDRSVSHP